MNALDPPETSRLLRLLLCDDLSTLYIDGDHDRNPIVASPFGEPVAIPSLRVNQPFSSQRQLVADKAPAGANAYILGDEVESPLGAKFYIQPVQFYQLHPADHRRGAGYHADDWTFLGFLPA